MSKKTRIGDEKTVREIYEEKRAYPVSTVDAGLYRFILCGDPEKTVFVKRRDGAQISLPDLLKELLPTGLKIEKFEWEMALLKKRAWVKSPKFQEV